MPMLSPRPRSTAADLLRVLAAWLAAILLLQGIAAAHALGQGPLHRHRDATGPAAVGHAHHHDGAERHVHEVADASVLRVGAHDESTDVAAFALTVALALMLLGSWLRNARDASRGAWPNAPRQGWVSVVPAGLLRPPRRA